MKVTDRVYPRDFSHRQLLDRQLRDRLEAGDLFCAESNRYRSFEDDLVDEATAVQKATLLPQLGLAEANTPIKQQLTVLREALNDRLDEVNARILRGDNLFVQVRHGKTVWARANKADFPRSMSPCSTRQTASTSHLAVART